jgi:hypothetical protein
LKSLLFARHVFINRFFSLNEILKIKSIHIIFLAENTVIDWRRKKSICSEDNVIDNIRNKIGEIINKAIVCLETNNAYWIFAISSK